MCYFSGQWATVILFHGVTGQGRIYFVDFNRRNTVYSESKACDFGKIFMDRNKQKWLCRKNKEQLYSSMTGKGFKQKCNNCQCLPKLYRPAESEISQGIPTSAFCSFQFQDEGDRVFKIPEAVTLWLIYVGPKEEALAHFWKWASDFFLKCLQTTKTVLRHPSQDGEFSFTARKALLSLKFRPKTFIFFFPLEK